eukprot:205301_1
MPVRTRSQRLKEELSSSSEGSAPGALKQRAIKKSKGHKSRKSDKEEMEEKSEETTAYKSNVEELRNYVKNILDSPNKVALPSTHRRRQEASCTPVTPRVDRITINKDQPQQQMEFLIPPKHRDTPMEKRAQLRSVLAHDSPTGIPERSPSYPVVYNEETKLWTPNVPSYNEEEADKISRLLIIFIFTILCAVFFSYYQEEIAAFVRTQLNPMGQSLKQRMESWAAQGSTVWSSLWNEYWHKLVGNSNDTESIMEDTITK